MDREEFSNIFKKAFYAYDQTIKFLELVFKEREDYEHSKGNMNYSVRGCLNEFDIILQYSMLELAYADKCLESEEIAFIQDLTKYLDIVEFYKVYFKVDKLNWAALRDVNNLLPEILKSSVELVGSFALDFIESLKLYQAKHNDNSFSETFGTCMGFILAALALSDGRIDDEENGKETLMLAVCRDLINGSIEKAEKDVRKGVPGLKKEVDISSLRSFYENLENCHNIGGRKISYNEKELATVYIETDKGSGSGFIISQNGICFTCAHVVDEAKEIYVRLDDEDEDRRVFKAEAYHVDKENDFALLKIKGIENSYYFDLEDDMSTVKTGDDIAVFGFPFGVGLNRNVMELEPSLTKGYISSKNRLDEKRVYFMDAKSCPGNSGGPIFKVSSGKVIGYLCGAYGQGSNLLCFFRGLEAYQEYLKRK